MRNDRLQLYPSNAIRWRRFGWVPVLTAVCALACCAPAASAPQPAALSNPPISGALTLSRNHHYFQDAGGRALILNGSQTWNTFQDWGTGGAVQPLDFPAFVRFLTTHGHNFTLLWTVETPHFCNLPVVAGTAPDFTVTPFPWRRTGPGQATDGALKFDMTQFNPAFFERLRSRVQALDQAGIYAGVYLFTGEFLNLYRCANDGYPFTGANNINGIDDGYKSGRRGIESVSMTASNRITAVQDAYVDKVIDTLNDLPNVLWIVSEEAPPTSKWWNEHLIAHIREYEARKPHRHPIGYAAPIGVPDTVVYDSGADWVAPEAEVSPAASCGAGMPACKVNINDSDHSYFGLWNDTPQQDRNWAWENFTSGNQVLFMDPYLVDYPREDRNHCADPVRGICAAPDKRWDNLRDTLGYIRQFSRRIDLAAMAPQDSLCSTGYCLASTHPQHPEFLIYAPAGGRFTVNLSGLPASQKLAAEWFNPATGEHVHASAIAAGAGAQPFAPPFTGDAVLYLAGASRAGTSGRP
jgi:hypothetical protein